MRRFMMPPDWHPGSRCEISGERAHYLARVLRLVEGDTFPAMDSRAIGYECRIAEASPGRIILEVSPVSRDSEDTESAIVLVQALPKAGKMDLIVRQAVEAGVSVIIPLLSRHCVSRPGPGRESAAKKERWERIVREALQQSGSRRVTRILDIVEVEALPALLHSLAAGIDPERSTDGGEAGETGDTLRLLLHESPLDSATLHGYLGTVPGMIILCIGPEGGFSPGEISFFVRNGFRMLHFRAPVLRTETAALYAVAAVQTLISERSTWKPA